MCSPSVIRKFLVFSCQVMHCPTTNFHSWHAPKPTLTTWPPWFFSIESKMGQLSCRNEDWQSRPHRLKTRGLLNPPLQMGSIAFELSESNLKLLMGHKISTCMPSRHKRWVLECWWALVEGNVVAYGLKNWWKNLLHKIHFP